MVDVPDPSVISKYIHFLIVCEKSEDIIPTHYFLLTKLNRCTMNESSEGDTRCKQGRRSQNRTWLFISLDGSYTEFFNLNTSVFATILSIKFLFLI